MTEEDEMPKDSDACSAVLIPTLSVLSTHDRRYLHILRTINETAFQEAQRQFKGGMTLPIEGVPINMNSDFNTFDKSRQDYFNSLDYTDSNESAMDLLTKGLPPHVTEAWQTCIKA